MFQKFQNIQNKDKNARSGIRTHVLMREPEFKSGALDHSAILPHIQFDYNL